MHRIGCFLIDSALGTDVGHLMSGAVYRGYSSLCRRQGVAAVAAEIPRDTAMSRAGRACLKVWQLVCGCTAVGARMCLLSWIIKPILHNVFNILEAPEEKKVYITCSVLHCILRCHF